MTTKLAAAPQSDEALLAELNGALSKTGEPAPVEGDRIGAQPPTLDEQLETKSLPPKSSLARAANLDKTLAKKAGGFGYRVVVEGDYYAKSADAKGNVIKRYSLPFNLPALVNAKGEAALGIIVGASRPNGGLLRNALQKLDPLAVTYRTHAIASVTPLQGAPEPTSLAYMSFDALKQYVRENITDFPVDVDEYFNVEHLREDVIDFKVNATSDVVANAGTASEQRVKGGFGVKKTPSDRIVERHQARAEEKELADMNAGLQP
jgi:hypothetical protein